MKELHKIGRAFGYIYDYGEYPSGHVFNDEYIHDGVVSVTKDSIPYEWVFLGGQALLTPETGSAIEAKRGDLGSKLGLRTGKYSVQISDLRIMCFSKMVNSGRAPDVPIVTRQHVAQGGTVTLAAGSKFLVCDGSLQINGRVVDAFQTGKATTGDLTASATSDTILLLF